MERGAMEGEEDVGVIRDAFMRGWWGYSEVYDLFFTDRRIICAMVLSRKAWIGYITFIRLGGWYMAGRERRIYRRIFEGKTPQEILRLEPKNFEIPYKDVTSATLRKRWASGGIIEFVFKGMKKLTFLFPRKQFSDAEKIVGQVLGNKLQ